MRKCCIPYIPCQSLLLSTIVLNDITTYMKNCIAVIDYDDVWAGCIGVKTSTFAWVLTFGEDIPLLEWNQIITSCDFHKNKHDGGLT